MVRVWASATLAVISAVGLTFAGVYLTSGGTVWWEWLLLAIAIAAGISSGVLAKQERDARASQVIHGGAVGQQTASGEGTNITITADRGSAAAYQMGEVHLGSMRRRGKRKGS
jgi:hypothetical protein